MEIAINILLEIEAMMRPESEQLCYFVTLISQRPASLIEVLQAPHNRLPLQIAVACKNDLRNFLVF